VDGQLEPKVLADFQIHLDGCEPVHLIADVKESQSVLAEN